MTPLRILYVAKHGSGGNDDEDAIAHALRSLGHQVTEVTEIGAEQRVAREKDSHDLLLFHKWHAPHTLATLSIPKVFWYFDLVDFPSPSLRSRCVARKQWMADTIPFVDVGFCTDGDWVMKDESHKLVWLTQGIDVRVSGKGSPSGSISAEVLFVGDPMGGTKRQNFDSDLKSRYGGQYFNVRRGCHGRVLADLIASVPIVVAPDSPVTHHYWSNRVYNMLGFEAFLLHPYCRDLAKQYTNGDHLVFYMDRRDLHDRIAFYRNNPRERELIAKAGYEHTLAHHTYIKRCEALISVVRGRCRL